MPAPDRTHRRPVSLGVLVVLAVVVAGCGGGPEYFSAPDSPRADRQAAYGTGYGNEADIGNAVAGNCPTRFDFWTIRLRVEVTADSVDDVLAFFPNTPDGVRRVRPGGSWTFVLDKGRGHCRFAGPEGELETLAGPVVVESREGFTNVYGGYTKVDVTVDGVEFSLKQGETRSWSSGEVFRPDDPAVKTAEVVLRVRNR